jgi:hypothetical protein
MMPVRRQVDHDDKEHAALTAFNELWKSKFAHDSLLVFSTGRSHHLYEELRVRSSPNRLQITAVPVGPGISKQEDGLDRWAMQKGDQDGDSAQNPDCGHCLSHDTGHRSA